MTRKFWVSVGSLSVVLLAALGIAGVRRAWPRGSDEANAIVQYQEGLARLDSALMKLDGALAAGDPAIVRAEFRAARALYKRVELFVEYYGSFAARELNGPPLPKAEDEDPETPLPPVGFQMVEAMVFPALNRRDANQARQLVAYMRSATVTLARAGADTMPGDAYLFDAMRQEIARVSTLGIAGFDATMSGDAIIESADALDGVREVLARYGTVRARGDTPELARADGALRRAIAYLRANPRFDELDRLTFIAGFAMPAAHAVAEVQRALGVGAPAKPRAWSARVPAIYDRDAFNPLFFAATDARAATPATTALGRALFFDQTLSGTGTRSCASCHLPERAFTDGRARAQLLDTHQSGERARSTPTLLNAAFQPSLFADNRVRTLEDQATDVLGSPGEMGGSLLAAATALARRSDYVRRFAIAFPNSGDTALSPRTVRLALAAYVRSLVSLDSRFDRAARGDMAALTSEEQRGFNLFMGRAKCGTCHFAPLFNGAMPPTLSESEPEVIGVPRESAARRPIIDPDSGRFNVRRIDLHLHAFKTPTLRNVALTAPYMHNGVFGTLEEVVDFYDVGGGQGIGIPLPHQTLPADSLHLTRSEKRAVVAFLMTLTDTTGLTARPTQSGTAR